MAPYPFPDHRQLHFAPGRSGNAPGQIGAVKNLETPMLATVCPFQSIYLSGQAPDLAQGLPSWVIPRKSQKLGFEAALGTAMTGEGILMGGSDNQKVAGMTSCDYKILFCQLICKV